LADCPWLTYGRVYPAQLNLFVYGFAIPTVLAVGLWILMQAGRTSLAYSGAAVLGGILWNIGVLTGLVAILSGASTGYEMLEMPKGPVTFLFLGYVAIGVSALGTFSRREEGALRASQWYLLAALFWFPWIFTTANLLLQWFPVRGVMQSLIAWWYAGNLNYVFFWLAGLGIIFHFLPLLAGNRLHSRYLAIFAFWLIVLFGGWVGIPHGAPVPAWIPSVSVAFSFVLILAVLAVERNCRRTAHENMPDSPRGPLFGFQVFAVLSYVAAGFLTVFVALEPISQLVRHTWVVPAVAKLNGYGFLGMALFGAVYFIVPKLTGEDWPLPKLVKAHFWLGGIGLIVFVLSLIGAGLLQGIKLGDPAVPFLDVQKAMLMPFRMSTIGDLLMLVAHLLLAWNFKLLMYRRWRVCCKQAVRELTATTAEVKA
jgi:cytochrome c oxidase cbb3-type subunit 1